MNRTEMIGAGLCLSFLVLVGFTSATPVFAQGQNGILTGIVAAIATTGHQPRHTTAQLTNITGITRADRRHVAVS